MAIGNLLLRGNTTLIRALQLLCSAVALGIFSYFLAVLSRNDLPIEPWSRAIEGMSGAAVLYSIIGVLLTCFVGGISVFAFLAIILDICFVGCFIAIAVRLRNGANSCRGFVSTPLGAGQASDRASAGTSLSTACKLQKAVFAVAIAAAVLFALSAVLQYLLYNHNKKEKRYGPSPKNGYTSGSATTGKKPFWSRKKKNTRDMELGAVGAGSAVATEKHNQHNSTIRPSHDTAMTGSTAANQDTGYSNKYTHDPTHATLVNNYDGQPTGHHSNLIAEDTPHIHNNGYPHIEPPSHGGQVPHGPMPGTIAHDFNQTTYGRTNY
ncbi:MAG: hypothetical protein Q9187_004765 [Circinaria calcarea]